MKRFTLISSLLFMVLLLNTAVYPQCQVQTTNVIFESANSLTFDVYVKNTGVTSWTYSHGSFVWNYNTAFLNGGTPTFSLVPGYSDFPAAAQPPSALLSSPSIMRTSSNLPGSNGVILAGQNLRLYRFRLQTSAASFSGSTLNASWKTIGTPYTRIFSWNSGTGLPEENLSPAFIMDALLFEENFAYTEGDTLNGLNGWVVQPTASYVNSIKVVSPGLTYPNYGSVSGNAAKIDTTGQDLYHAFTAQTSGSIYVACLVNISKVTATGEYFIHLTDPPGSTTFKARVFAKSSGSDIVFGLLGKGSTVANTIYTTTTYAMNTTHLIVLKYTFNTGSTSDDSVYLFINPVVGGAEPQPDIRFGSVDPDFTTCGVVNLRQGSASSAPRLVLDGIRIGVSWTDILPAVGSPILSTSPSSLSGFGYLPGGGPSTSQSYDLSGTTLSPLSGNITVSGTSSYEVSLNNSTFGSSQTVSYNGGVLASTPIYVRLKAGLSAGIYNGELVSNAGGGADTAKVTCNGSVFFPEPTNHVTSFTGALGTPSYARINLTWVDATGGQIPDGYLIRGSTLGFDSIAAPIDGTPVANSFLVQNVLPGVQTYLFSALNGGRTYYFKIFPYTNSGATINYKTDGTIPVFSLATDAPPSLPIVETFNYTTGTYLTNNGWLSHSGAGSNPITVSPTPLTYSGYFASGVGKSVTLATSGEDDNRAFDSIKTGSVYGSFLVNVTSAQATGDYFFHFGPENTTSLYFGKVFARDSLGSLAFGVSKNLNATTGALFTPHIYSYGTTYLIVVKYTYNGGTTTDDEAKLWINPVLNGVEPPSDLTQTDAGTDAPVLGMFALRQGSATNAAALTVSGIRVATSWVPSTAGATLNLTAFIQGFWNGTVMVGDNVTVELRNSASPFAVVEQQTVSLNAAGTGTGQFFNAVDGVPYYIVVKHRNSVETWSAAPQQFTSGTLTYNFSSTASQAYGNNLVLKNTKWCLFSGDANQDGAVDLQDMKVVDNSLGNSGYVPGDINGDGTVSSPDMDIINVNSQAFAGVKKPAAAPENVKIIPVNPKD